MEKYARFGNEEFNTDIAQTGKKELNLNDLYKTRGLYESSEYSCYGF